MYYLVELVLIFLFFFFTQKTAYEMRISDWSSDVCSSDLHSSGSSPGEALPGFYIFHRPGPPVRRPPMTSWPGRQRTRPCGTCQCRNNRDTGSVERKKQQ